jgi:hypothetical protein
LAKKRSNVVYNIIPKFQEWLIINYEINVVESIPLGFQIFKGKRLFNDYITFYKLEICLAMQKKFG